jgi:hypothetical protein
MLRVHNAKVYQCRNIAASDNILIKRNGVRIHSRLLILFLILIRRLRAGSFAGAQKDGVLV